MKLFCSRQAGVATNHVSLATLVMFKQTLVYDELTNMVISHFQLIVVCSYLQEKIEFQNSGMYTVIVQGNPTTPDNPEVQ